MREVGKSKRGCSREELYVGGKSTGDLMGDPSMGTLLIDISNISKDVTATLTPPHAARTSYFGAGVDSYTSITLSVMGHFSMNISNISMNFAAILILPPLRSTSSLVVVGFQSLIATTVASSTTTPTTSTSRTTTAISTSLRTATTIRARRSSLLVGTVIDSIFSCSSGQGLRSLCLSRMPTTATPRKNSVSATRNDAEILPVVCLLDFN
ncbi:hypothetical protein BDQ12DRAFT_384651 [Crucibulum laeve]|uniref:Uncharacterized protein n=1 Tax=Crucibulum laeve TaxID=68775 RepID=A0A5C3LMR7_9AGAR|nr:hypothetical protein BDQ12DRAFT_384651 [Crucibulum laeve]